MGLYGITHINHASLQTNCALSISPSSTFKYTGGKNHFIKKRLILFFLNVCLCFVSPCNGSIAERSSQIIFFLLIHGNYNHVFCWVIIIFPIDLVLALSPESSLGKVCIYLFTFWTSTWTLNTCDTEASKAWSLNFKAVGTYWNISSLFIMTYTLLFIDTMQSMWEGERGR